jgi:hypothetical protein
MNTRRYRVLSILMSLLVAFAVSTSAASISSESVAAVLAAERGIHVSPTSVHLQISGETCGVMRIASLRQADKHMEAVVRCSERKLPFIVRIDGVSDSKQPDLVSANMMAMVPPLVRRGAVIRLLMNSEKARLTLPAICLEAGVKGQKVRVRIQGTHKIHLARVADRSTAVEEVQ